MLQTQDTEMAQLQHEQQSIASIMYLAQHLELELPLRGYFLLKFIGSMLALGIFII